MYPRSGRLIALYSVFNSEDLIEESMRSLLGVVDEYRIYDGRYKGYVCTCGKEHDNSCDSTAARVQKFASDNQVNVKQIDLPVMFEYDKRQRMFDGLYDGDTALVIDDDELFYGDWLELKVFANKPLLNGTQPFVYPKWDYGSYKAGYILTLMLGAARQSFIRVHVKTPNLRLVAPENKLDYSFVDDEGIYKPGQVYQLRNARLIHAMASGQANIPAYRSKPREAAGYRYHDAMGKGLIKP